MALLLVSLVPGAAWGATALDWQAPPGCPDAAQVTAKVDELIGASTVARARTLVARAQVEHGEARWRVTIDTDVDGVRGQRVLEGETCASVADATAFILAITLDPGLSLPVEPPPREPRPRPVRVVPAAPPPKSEVAKPAVVPPSASPVVVATTPLASPPASQSAPRSLQARLGATAGLTVGAVPGTTADAEIAAALASRRVSSAIELEAFLRGAWPREVADLDAAPWIVTRVRGWRAGLAVCGGGRGAAWSVRVCPAAGAERLSGKAAPVAAPGEGAVWLLFAGMRGALGYALSPSWSVVASVESAARLHRPPLTVEPLGVAWQPPHFWLRAALGVEARF